MDIVLGIILLIAAVFLVVSVLLQNGKTHNVGAITGGAETFFGKTKGSTMDRMLNKITSIVAIAFCVIVALMYIMQEDTDFSNIISTTDPTEIEDVAEGEETVDAADTDAAAE